MQRLRISVHKAQALHRGMMSLAKCHRPVREINTGHGSWLEMPRDESSAPTTTGANFQAITPGPVCGTGDVMIHLNLVAEILILRPQFERLVVRVEAGVAVVHKDEFRVAVKIRHQVVKLLGGEFDETGNWLQSPSIGQAFQKS